jgi:hypothetical protein
LARAAPLLPQPQQLERQDADAVNAERRQVAEEQRDDKAGRDEQPKRPDPFAQRYPRRQRPQRKADAEQIIHQPDKKDVVVEQRNGDQRKQ